MLGLPFPPPFHSHLRSIYPLATTLLPGTSVSGQAISSAVTGRTGPDLRWHLGCSQILLGPNLIPMINLSNEEEVSNLNPSNKTQEMLCHQAACGCVRKEGRAKESEAMGLLQKVSSEMHITSSSQKERCSRPRVWCVANRRDPAVRCQEWRLSAYS